MFIKSLLKTTLLFSCLFPITTFAAETLAQDPIKVDHVIYITLDGTRWQEVFLNHKYLPRFWLRHARQTTFYGKPKTDDKMEVASIPTSLPSYQSQMAGYVQPCDSNECGRIQVETIAENLVHTYGYNKKDVAVFSSWYEIAYAAEHIEGTIFTNSGNMPVADPDTQQADPVMDKINQEQALDHPDGSDRYDKYTFAQALHYLKKYQPKFMWISMQDTDEAAHQGDWNGYVQALNNYDQDIDTLLTTLKRMKLDKSTLVIITTDHGRGNGKNWTTHGPKIPESKQTWAFVINGKLKFNQDGQYNTLSIRPSIEDALGLNG